MPQSGRRAVLIVRDLEQARVLLDETRAVLLRELWEPGSASALARKLGLPRQRLNYHLRELERVGLVEFVEERRRGNCVERVVRAIARRFLVSPLVAAGGGAPGREEGSRYSPAVLAQAAARVIDDLARADERTPTLTLDASVRFTSEADRNAFAEDLAAEFSRLVKEYDDAGASGSRAYRFVVGGYAAGEGSRGPSGS